MPDAAFEDPRLAPLYDVFDDDRRDLDVYLAIVDELGGHRVLDVGCGTGTFALSMASKGLDVLAVDPAKAMLEVALAKPGAEMVRWLHGDATTLPDLTFDLATMTGNVAQAIVDPEDWSETLGGIHAALCRAGFLVLETRDPASRAWEDWNREKTHRVVEVGGRPIERWTEVTDITPPLVTFQAVFVVGDEVLTSRSTLRFRERAEVQGDLSEHGYELVEVRDAPDRPGRELVFIAQRSEP